MSRSVGQCRWKSSRKFGQSSLQAVRLEISNRKREAVVDTDQGGRIFGKPFDQPFGDATTGPVFARAWWWNHLDGRRCTIRCIDFANLLGLLLETERLNNRCRHTGRTLAFMCLSWWGSVFLHTGEVVGSIRFQSVHHPPIKSLVRSTRPAAHLDCGLPESAVIGLPKINLLATSSKDVRRYSPARFFD